MIWIALLITIVIFLGLVSHFLLAGQNLSRFDSPLEDAADDVFDSHPDDHAHNKKIIAQLNQTRQEVVASKSLLKGLKIARFFADNFSCDLITNTKFIPVKEVHVKGEWAISEHANPDKRILFFHGGAFLFGSSKGHRKFTDHLSKVSGAAVFSVDYRLLLKHNRYASVRDAQQAYLWILENSPTEQKKCNFLMVAGDSAGGNLTHMLASWSKNNAPRQPNGVIGFSPSLDQTLSSHRLKKNQQSDPMLGKGLNLLISLPRHIRLWVLFIVTRSNPSNPLVSPLYGDLSDLPPTLIHASSSEMLLGESICYVNRARAQGSKIKFQVWHKQIHDWHLFNLGHASANVAWN